MDSIKFQEYYNDKDVIKLSDWQGCFFFNKENEIIVFFAFFHLGLNNVWRNAPNKRIDFLTYKSNIYTGPKPLQEIGHQKLFLVNSQHPNFAILYKAIIDNENRLARLELIELPELGHSLITDEEKNGIEIPF